MKFLHNIIRNKLLTQKNNYLCLSSSFSTNSKKKICIVGAGPAGFYNAQYLLKHLQDCSIDMVEKLPVPFGLVRFGVAPDHAEVKNVINTFNKVAEHPNFRFFGNITLGQDITLQDLRERYHAVLLTYGANRDNKLEIPTETDTNVLSARQFVAWYNGLPGEENLNPDLSKKHIAIVGQGNVAIDVSRILLSPIDSLKETDITHYALEALSKSKVERIYLVGRRGPLQAAFTIKELREMLKLPDVSTIWRPEDFNGISEMVPKLQRPRKRITELMLTSLEGQKHCKGKYLKKQFMPIFYRSPKSISDKYIELTINKLKDNKAIPTEDVEHLEVDSILRSIGYKSTKVDNDMYFDDQRGLIFNKNGRVLQKGSNVSEEKYEPGLYVSGWLGTGPVGVILATMNGAYMVANNILIDFKENKIKCDSKPELDLRDKRVVTWSGWLKIDKAELEEGKKRGKLREKIVNIDEMLKVAGV